MNLILSPHFDDAVLSLGGLLAKEGEDSVVATFFAGTPPAPLVRPWDVSGGFKDSAQAMRERIKEDGRALALLGVSPDRIRTYGHLDFQYRREKSGKPLPLEPELFAAIQEEIASLIREFDPTHLKIFAPGLETGKVHPDHAMLKRAAIAARRMLPAESVDLFFYQDLPYAISIMDGAHPRKVRYLFMRKNAGKRDYSLIDRSVAGSSSAMTPVVIPLTSADMARKLAATALYASQVRCLGPNLLRRIKRYGAGQARARATAPYCEIVYALS